MPPELRNRIRTAYDKIYQLPPKGKLERKIPIMITGEDKQVHIDEIINDDAQQPQGKQSAWSK
jgi:hypothetical protein